MELKRKHLGIPVCIAMAVALGAMFLPFIEIKLFGNYSMTAIDLWELENDYSDTCYMTMLIGGTVVGLLLALGCTFSTIHFSLPMLISIASVGGCMYVMQDDLEYVGMGFIAFIIAHIATVILCINAMSKISKEQANPTTPTEEEKTQESVLIQETVPAQEMVPTQKFCYNCGTQLLEGSQFCHNCGANQKDIQ